MSSLHLVSDDGTQLLLHGERGLSPRLRDVNRELPVGKGLIGRVAATGETLCIENNAQEPGVFKPARAAVRSDQIRRSEEHTSELQSLRHLVCRLLLEKKKQIQEIQYQ